LAGKLAILQYLCPQRVFLVRVNCENWPIHPRLTLPQKECSIYNAKEVITFHQSIDGTTAVEL
jgi:hypothetical protein